MRKKFDFPLFFTTANKGKLDHLAGTPPKEIKQSVEKREEVKSDSINDTIHKVKNMITGTSNAEKGWQKFLARRAYIYNEKGQ